MTTRDVLYNDLRDYLTSQGVEFTDDLAPTLVGDEILKNLSSTLFALIKSVWKAINDKHNRRGHALDLEFAVFFGRKILGQKTDRPCMPVVVQHVQDLWLGMRSTYSEAIER